MFTGSLRFHRTFAFCLWLFCPAFQPTPVGRTACEYGKNLAQHDCLWWKRAKEYEWHFLPHTLTVDGGYLSPTSNTILPQSPFHSSRFCPFRSFTIKASTFAFQFLFASIHHSGSTPPFCPPQNMLDLHTPRCSSQCVSTPLAVSATLSGLAGEKRQPAGGGPGLPECVATLPSNWHQHRVLCYGWLLIYHSERTMRRRDERAGASLCGSGHRWVTHHMESMDWVVFTVIWTTNRLHRQWFKTPCCISALLPSTHEYSSFT